MADVFISYKAEEFDEANWVRSMLENNCISCWMAPMSISGGSSYAVEIPKAIKSAKAFVLILSEKCQRSIWVPREIDQAINEGKTILPFMIEDCPLKEDFNFYLSNVQRYPAFKGKESAVKQMIADIHAVLEGRKQEGVVFGHNRKQITEDKALTQNKRRHKSLLILSLVVAVAIAAALCFVLLKPSNQNGANDYADDSTYMDKTKVSVPEIGEGHTYEYVKDILEKSGFECCNVEYPSHDVEKGYVISISPEPGEMLDKGSTIIVYTSVGSEQYGDISYDTESRDNKTIVGNYVGISFSEAATAISSANLEYSTNYIASKEPYGTVVSQYPRAYSSIVIGDSVSLTISDGSLISGNKDNQSGSSSGYNDSGNKVDASITDAVETVFFGSYEQDNDESNGKEAIEWVVLARKGNKAFVISKYALDCLPYNTSGKRTTWEMSSLREWLNNEFFSSAFTPSEQNAVQMTAVTADPNPRWNTYPTASDTNDRVFLLSISEAKEYFASNTARKCTATEYAKNRYAYYVGNTDYSSLYYSESRSGNWWLRTPGHYEDYAADICGDGSVSLDGFLVGYVRLIRPAMWIEIGK